MFLVLIPILNYISNLCLHLYLVNCLKAKFQKTVIFLVHIYHFVLHYTFQVLSCPMRCFVLQGDRVVQLSRRQSLTRWQVSPLCGDTCCCCTLRNVNHTDYKITSAANQSIGEDVQSRRRPLLGPSPGWKRLLSMWNWVRDANIIRDRRL